MNVCGRIYMADTATGKTARCGKEAGHKDALDHGPGIPVETIEGQANDPEGVVLEVISEGHPYVMAIATPGENENDIHIRLCVGGGVSQLSTVRALLERALEAVTKAGG